MDQPEHPALPIAQHSEDFELHGIEARVNEALRVELEQQEPSEVDGDVLEGEVMGM